MGHSAKEQDSSNIKAILKLKMVPIAIVSNKTAQIGNRHDK